MIQSHQELPMQLRKGGGMAKPCILKRERMRLRELIRDGLSPAYTGWRDYLFDFYSDFTWNSNHSHRELDWLLKDNTWNKLARQLNAKHNFDFIAEVTKGRDAR